VSALLLIAGDTVRSVRRHRTLLAVLLLFLGTAGALTAVARDEARGIQHRALQRHVREDTPRTVLARRLAAKQAELRQTVEQARKVRSTSRGDRRKARDFRERMLADMTRTPGPILYGGKDPRVLSPDEVRAIPRELQEMERSVAEHSRRARDISFQTARREATEVQTLEAELVALGPEDAQEDHAEHITPEDPDAEAARLMAQRGTIYAGFFNFAMSFGGAILALGLFCTGIASEVGSGTIRATLSKPVSRTQFLLGKCLGAALVLLAYSGLTATVATTFGTMQHAPLSPALAYEPWLGFCSNLMLGGVGLLFSLFVRPAVAGVLAWFTSASCFRWFTPLYAILPSYDSFQASSLLFGQRLSASDLLLSSLYAADVIVILVAVALYRFERMELV